MNNEQIKDLIDRLVMAAEASGEATGEWSDVDDEPEMEAEIERRVQAVALLRAELLKALGIK